MLRSQEELEMTTRLALAIALAAATAFLTGACDSPTEPKGVQALYTLIRLNGEQLPTAGATNGGCAVTVTHGSFALDSNGRYSALLDAGDSQCPNGLTGKAYWPDSGRYRIAGAQIHFVPDGSDAPYDGHFVPADTASQFVLEVSHARGQYSFFRVPFR
jgi:hypothetical protein